MTNLEEIDLNIPEFNISEKQKKKIENWLRVQKNFFNSESPRITGQKLSYIFTPTTLGLIIEIRHMNGKILDITDYDEWK